MATLTINTSLLSNPEVLGKAGKLFTDLTLEHWVITSAILLLLTGCKTSKTAERVSWEAFCQEYEYSYNTEDSEAINDYLDCWRGSAQEETILLNNGYEPF